MASIQELFKLNNQGDLGEMLAKKFGGERDSCLCPRKDAELMISFESRSKTPGAEEIGIAVIEHYRKLGYIVEPNKSHGSQGNCFQAIVFYNTYDHGSLSVVITTFYPLSMGDDHNHLRITTEFCL